MLFRSKLDGKKLFQYIDDNNKIKQIKDFDLNNYLHTYMGKFSIKDFRTYGGNYYFIKSLLLQTQKYLPTNDKIINHNISHALKITAYHLRHSKSISKKNYVMNYIIELYQSNPDYFIRRKYDDVDLVLIDLLKKYKKTYDN